MNLYVGNLSWGLEDADISQLFEQYGPVKSVNLIMDRETGRSKGFAFVEMKEKSDGERAIEELNGKDVEGRALTVNEARPREERPRNNFGGGGGDRRGGGYGGGDRRGGGNNDRRGGNDRRRNNDW